MTTLARPFKPIIALGLDILIKIKVIWIGALVMVAGMLLGYLFSTPDQAQLIVSIIVTIVTMLAIIKNFLYGILVWLALTPFLEYSIFIPLGESIPDLTLGRFIMVFLAIFMLASAAIGKFKFARIGLAEICIIAATLGIITAAPMAINPTDAMQKAIDWHFSPMLIYFFTKNLVRSEKDLYRVFLAVATLGFMLSLYATYELTTGNILFVPESAEISYIFREGGIRVIRGVLGSSGAMGRALAATIPVTFYLFLEHKKIDKTRFFLAVALALEVYGTFAAMSRTPWYALLIGLFIMQFFYPEFRKVFFIIVLVAAVVIWATWDQVNDSAVSGRINENTSDFNGRSARWEAGRNMWRAKPIRGWGFDGYQQNSGRFRSGADHRNFRAIENDYLYILVGSGLIGFLPYALFLLTPLINSLRLFRKARAPGWTSFVKQKTIATYWAVILCLLITSYTAICVQPVIKLIPFAITGAVVGSQEHWLRNKKAKAVRIA